MGVGFTQRFTYDPGNGVITRIEGVTIIDREPPESIIGVGTGTACIVGEFENGPFGVATEVTSYTGLKSQFGAFGYTYAGQVGQNPCARQRFADSAATPEYWNGNGAVQLSNKAFSRLLIMRVNTSQGSAQFTRQANLVGGNLFRYGLVSGEHLDVSVDGAAAVSCAFTGVAATVTSGAQTYSAIVAGDTLALGADAQQNFAVTFLASDVTQAAVVARINQYAGFNFAAVVSGTTIAFTGLQAGTGGQVRVVGGSAIAAGKLNLTVATTAGTGNVANIAQVAPSEINTVVNTALVTAKVELLSTGYLRIYRISAAPATDSISVASTSTATFGFPVGVTDAASTGNAGIIPAGTVVQNAGGTLLYVTMQDVSVTATAIAGTSASGAGPYPVPVRAAQDDGTQTGVGGVGLIDVVSSATPITLDSFAVVNPLAIAGALTENQIDAAYANAIAATLNSADVSHDINILWSARQSNTTRTQLKSNTQTAGDGGGVGVLGRIAIVRPPIGTLEASAVSNVAQPGVGAYRYERVVYTWPQVTTYVANIAAIGIAGGTGFTANGIVTVGADGWMASICSQLNPEENPGQLTSFTGNVTGLEPGLNGGVSLELGDYIALKAAGIAAPKMTSGAMIFQSGVTSVSPIAYPAFAPIHRRRMADYIQDSIAAAMDPYVKKLMTLARRQAIVGAIKQFLIGLLSPTNLNSQRIAGYYVDAKTPNLAPAGGVAPTQLGIFRVIILVTTLPSLDDIVLDTTIGDSVVITPTQ